MAEIIIEIDEETAGIKVEGMGFKGNQCIKDIDKLMKEIGARTISRRSKPELVRQQTMRKQKI